jgi:hypothetical protein
MSALQFSPGFIFSDRKKSTSFISDRKASIISLASFALLDLWLTKIRFVSLIGMSSGIRLVRFGSALSFQGVARLDGLLVLCAKCRSSGPQREESEDQQEEA